MRCAANLAGNRGLRSTRYSGVLDDRPGCNPFSEALVSLFVKVFICKLLDFRKSWVVELLSSYFEWRRCYRSHFCF